MGIGKVYIPRTDDVVEVNWYRDGQLGVTYINKPISDGTIFCNVFEEDEVEFRFGEIKPSSEKKDVRKELKAGDLRERLRKLREEANQLSTKKRKKTRKKRKKSRAKKDPKSIVDSLSEEQLKLLKEQLKNNS